MDGKSVMSEDLQQPCTEAAGDPNEFLELAAMRMPFGKAGETGKRFLRN
jgi:hypothetical protein